MTNVQKKEILQLIEDEKTRLGSYRAVAKKCSISEAAISQLRGGTYLAEGDDVYLKIALALDYSFDNSGWNIATETTDFRIITEVLSDAKNESMFIGVSDNAGCGKTAPSDIYLNWHKKEAVFKINCKEWGARKFLEKIAVEVGATIPKGYGYSTEFIETITDTIKGMADKKPLLIIDQANSLKPAATCMIIHLFNELEGMTGLVALGTENLEHQIKKGVRLNKTGFDEVDSRFGRKYIKTVGATLADTRKICAVNGITDDTLQKEVFKACEPIERILSDGSKILVIKDKRRLKRVIQRERLNHN
ncbi:ATP-binding protein [Dysgonomonas sp. HGC4]|uniref:ATP-binding protein n=1 Tax=Dysgonomonas sp. HGC4 TaxID=1658009 RepID=UPI000682F02D|nr:ATP-binding protein [Dysgonomonas sp. HGC4]MBD8348557.1 ATP-binding protein [Dysgonomonas sp. HGC4]